MIEGSVNAALEAVVTLDLRGPADQIRSVDAVVDTGFSRFLTVPSSVVAALGLAFAGARLVALADGSEVALDAYAVTVLWDGRPREIVAYAAGNHATDWNVHARRPQPVRRGRERWARRHRGPLKSTEFDLVDSVCTMRQASRRRSGPSARPIPSKSSSWPTGTPSRRRPQAGAKKLQRSLAVGSRPCARRCRCDVATTQSSIDWSHRREDAKSV